MKRHWRTGIVMVSLIAVAAVGCATGSDSMKSSSMKMGSGDIVADRQRLMKLNGASWADAQAKFKAGNIEGIAVNAETMAINSEHIPMLFPQGSLTEKSKAKPEIWQKWPEFESAGEQPGAMGGAAARRVPRQGRAANRGDHEGVRRQGVWHLPPAVPRPTAPSRLGHVLGRGPDDSLPSGI